jgi:pimeloyl-ACP methyl ester carboxylesterase
MAATPLEASVISSCGDWARILELRSGPMTCLPFPRTSVPVALALLAVVAPSAAAAQFLNCHDVKIHYVVQGSGEPVLLIHGLYSSTALNWQAPGVFGELAKDHRVIAFDLPGHGRSDKPEDQAAYGLAIIDDIVALLDHLNVKRVHIVGYSIGGMIAVKFLALHPDRAKSGVIGGMGWFRVGSPQQKFWERNPKRPSVPAAFFQGVTQFAVTAEELKQITIPAEVLVGDRDPVKQLYVAALRKARPDWPILEIAGAGHITCIMKPEFRDDIATWLRKQSKP